jgi:DNA-3-methyladenine glycosylase I
MVFITGHWSQVTGHRIDIKMTKKLRRCAWPKSPIMLKYHDKEWGVPIHNDRKLFEFIVLDGMQAGLSWETILKKRAAYKKVFLNFNPKKVSKFNAKKVEALLQNPGIIRNRLKIESAITNARAFLKVKREFGTFDRYIWSFVGGKPIVNKWKSLKEIPCKTRISDAMSEDLKKRGFKFVGSLICYAFMQAAGLVNDHTITCFRYKKLI